MTDFWRGGEPPKSQKNSRNTGTTTATTTTTRRTKNEAAAVASAVIQHTVVTVSPKSKVLFVCKTVSKCRREMGVLRTG